MDLDYNLFNILILFGAIQGFILCVFLYPKRKTNYISVDFFLLFLFSLSFFNLIYAFLDMDLFRYHRPLHLFPFPYKWLSGAGFYFYIKNQFPPAENKKNYHIREWYLLAPAMIYMALRTYWFAISVKEDSFRITNVIVESGFFRIHEFFIQFFTLSLGIGALRFLVKHQKQPHSKFQSSLKWLKKFTWVFIIIAILDILFYSLDLVVHSGKETFGFYYATLIINSAFIYWIGFMGFTKSKLFFNVFNFQSNAPNMAAAEIETKLEQAIHENTVYTNPNLTVSELALELNISVKELSKHINENKKMNFSEYMNFHRIERIKELMASPDVKKYTLVTLAENAGFSSKSSFNATFKKVTGLTPSEYRKENPSS